MRKSLCAILAATFVSAVSVSALDVADYQDDFQVDGGPAAGWSYLWNPNSGLGDSDDYVPLVIDNGQYETQANGAYPDAAPGAYLAAGSGSVDPVLFPDNAMFPPYPSTFVRPGQGPAQDPNDTERAVITGYTFSADDIAAGGNQAFITDYYFALSTTAADGMSARVYHRAASATTDTLLLELPPFPAGFIFYTALDPDPIPLATVAPGDTIYVAIGPFLSDSQGAAPGDEMRMDYTLSLFVPEPGALSLVAIAAAGLLRRRR